MRLLLNSYHIHGILLLDQRIFPHREDRPEHEELQKDSHLFLPGLQRILLLH